MKIGIISDIHGNHFALEKVLESASKNKVEKLLVLGDIVGYYYHPNKAMDLLKKWDYELIQGNHERIMMQLNAGNVEMASLRNKYGCGHQIAIDKLSEQQFNELVDAPEKKAVTIDGVNILMCHGSNWDADYYIYPDASTDVLSKCNEPSMDFVVIGHSHYQFVYRNRDSTLINVGSVGQSRTTGGVANWAIINTANKSFELKSTNYDVNILLEEVKQVDLPVNYLQEILKRNN
jgi:putative phosphoesterase